MNVIDEATLKTRLDEAIRRAADLQAVCSTVEYGSEGHQQAMRDVADAHADVRLLRRMIVDRRGETSRQGRSIVGAINAARAFAASAQAVKVYLGRANSVYEKWHDGGLPATAAECMAELAIALEVEQL